MLAAEPTSPPPETVSTGRYDLSRTEPSRGLSTCHPAVSPRSPSRPRRRGLATEVPTPGGSSCRRTGPAESRPR